ncbi:hypothetical protein JW933_08180 [candidate division FCPU426 bacterium]|nr:hypothetical protein [candidate division FCPU426 bacterium]
MKPGIFPPGIRFWGQAGIILFFISAATAFPCEGARVTTDLILLYTFSEGSGSTVNDTSGVTPAIPLTINNPAAVQWLADAIDVNTTTSFSSSVTAAKVMTACQSSNELTLEAWVKADNLAQGGPARIISFSQDSAYRNFTLGAETTQYVFRVRTTDTSTNGTPEFFTSPGLVTTNLTHVACTRNSSGQVAIYVDSLAVSTTTISGNFSNWDSLHSIVAVNELTEDRPWWGEVHLIAVYSRALNSSEIYQNFLAGANPAISPTPTRTATSSPTRTRTPTPSVTPTPDLNSTSTATATSTSSRTLTITVTPSPTPTPTATPPLPPGEDPSLLASEKDVMVYPSPAKGDTVYFLYYVPWTCTVTNEIYNVLGERVATIKAYPQTPGRHRMTWDIRDVAPGVYFSQLRLKFAWELTQDFDQKKFVIIK